MPAAMAQAKAGRAQNRNDRGLAVRCSAPTLITLDEVPFAKQGRKMTENSVDGPGPTLTPAETAPPAGTVPPTSAKPAKKEDNFFVFLIKLVLIVVFFRSFVFSPFNIPSESMLPRLQNGDYLLAAKWPFGFSRYSLPFRMSSGRATVAMAE